MVQHTIVDIPKQYAEVDLVNKHIGELEKKTMEIIPDVDMKKDENVLKKHGGHHDTTTKSNSIWLLCFCFSGIMVSFTLFGLVLEQMTNHRAFGELSLTAVFCFFYSIVALILRWFNQEKPSTMPQVALGAVGLLAFCSTISSMVALRYVTMITRILGKSCKSIPVMLMGVVLGKRYALKKYISVIVLSIGVGIFLVGTAHLKEAQHAGHETKHTEHHGNERTPNIVLGFGLLVLSLLFDGATGALEDHYMEKYHIGAFDLMYTVNIYKFVFATIGMVMNGEVESFLENIVPNLPNVILLSLSGALGQAFIFFTISKFGALTTSIIGTCRKVLSIVLSVILFGHILSMEQTTGLILAFTGISLNWVRKFTLPSIPCLQHKPLTIEEERLAEIELSLAEGEVDLEMDKLLVDKVDTALSEETVSSGSDEEEYGGGLYIPTEQLSEEERRGREMVEEWHRQHTEQMNQALEPAISQL